jgi:Zn-dependent M28 family amino/carboxypeptidase
MGKDVFFPGANDNASGIAMMLNLVYHYTQKEVPKKTMVFMAFGAEEAGIIGSKHYTQNPLFPLERINFLINVDIMGTGEEGIQVVNGSEFKPQFDKLAAINSKNNYLKQVKIRGKAANSDHYWFAEKGVPAIFIYTLGGIKAYHDVYDVSKTLPLTKFEDCFRLLTDFVNEL